MSGVEGVVTEVLREHAYVPVLRSCKCQLDGEYPNLGADEHAAHAAAAVVQALGLTAEFAYIGKSFEDDDPHLDEWSCGHQVITEGRNYGVVHEGYDEPVTRWVSPWVAVERGEQ